MFGSKKVNLNNRKILDNGYRRHSGSLIIIILNTEIIQEKKKIKISKMNRIITTKKGLKGI